MTAAVDMSAAYESETSAPDHPFAAAIGLR